MNTNEVKNEFATRENKNAKFIGNGFVLDSTGRKYNKELNAV